jgi:hypothetical protein
MGVLELVSDKEVAVVSIAGICTDVSRWNIQGALTLLSVIH